uniref:Uncharacterized protein n=1 Tax=Spongospora subterranea TaxID=70186 RepID=A0A0H5RQM7_9EUKA|eukprot:CRZ11014.1 hypothetical protein [Spongospora subterranea]
MSQSPETSFRDYIWAQKKRDAIARLAAQGIEVSEDDPILSAPLDHGGSKGKPEFGHGRRKYSDKSDHYITPANELSISQKLCGADNNSYAPHQKIGRPFQEKMNRQDAPDSISFNEAQNVSQRRKNSNVDLPYGGKTSSTPSPSLSIAFLGADPEMQRIRRRQMQQEMNAILQQQIRDKQDGRHSLHSAMPVRSSSSNSPVENAPRQTLLSPSPASRYFGDALSISALDRDPEKEGRRKQEMKTELSSYLQFQINEKQHSSDVATSTNVAHQVREVPTSQVGTGDAYSPAILEKKKPADTNNTSRDGALPTSLIIGTQKIVEDERKRRKEYADILKIQIAERKERELQRKMKDEQFLDRHMRRISIGEDQSNKSSSHALSNNQQEPGELPSAQSDPDHAADGYDRNADNWASHPSVRNAKLHNTVRSGEIATEQPQLDEHPRFELTKPGSSHPGLNPGRDSSLVRPSQFVESVIDKGSSTMVPKGPDQTPQPSLKNAENSLPSVNKSIVDWDETERTILGPFRMLRERLENDSKDVLERINNERLRLCHGPAVSHPDPVDNPGTLRHSTSEWVPIEAEAPQISCKTEFVNVPIHKEELQVDADILERFVNENDSAIQLKDSGIRQRRPQWGAVAVAPSQMSGSEVGEKPVVPMLKERSQLIDRSDIDELDRFIWDRPK